MLRGVSDTPTSDATAPRELARLASADNFRDVAGTGAGYPVAGGGRVRRGVFYRSNELQLTAADAGTLADLGIARIHDLRGQMEIEAHPDVEVPGAVWHHVEVSGIPMEMISGLEDSDAAVRVMCQVYDAFVRAPAARASYAELLTDLATGPLPQLFHCTAGKDRTGWAAALLLEIAGVDRRHDPGGLPADQHVLVGDAGEVPRADRRAPRRRQDRGLRADDGRGARVPADGVRHGRRALRLGRRLPARRARPRRGTPRDSCVPV